jgi:hypothetical protein
MENLLTFFNSAEQSSQTFERPKYEIIYQQLEQFEIAGINIKQNETKFKFKCITHEMYTRKQEGTHLKTLDVDLYLSEKPVQQVSKLLSSSFKSLVREFKVTLNTKPQ